MALDPNEYDSRIAMAPGYTRPRPRIKKSKWPGRLRKLFIALVVLAAIPVGLELALSRERIIPTLDRPSDYRPLAITRLFAPTGEIVGEIAGARRRVVPADKMPPALARAVVERLEAAYLTRPALGRADLVRAVLAHVRGQAEAVPITLRLVRDLAGPSTDPTRFAKEWLAAIGLERRLDRKDLLQIFLNQAPFGKDTLGVEEAARARFGRSVTALDDKQLRAIAELADRTDASAGGARATIEAAGCGQLSAQKLRERYEADELAHLGAEVVTPCEPALTKAMAASIARQHLDKSGLGAAAVVMRLPGQELAAVVGDVGTPRAIGALRAPLVIAAALATLKWTLITPLSSDGPPLHVAALRSLSDAADGVLGGGLSPAGLTDLVGKMGVATALDAEAFARGTAGVTPLEVGAVFAVIAEGGQRRLPQLLRSIDGTPESEGAKAAMPVLLPEVAFLTAQLMQTSQQKAPPPKPGKRGEGAWSVLISADLVVVVCVAFPDGRPLPDSGEGERAAATIAREVQGAALRGKAPRPFTRPRGMIARRVDPSGHLLRDGVAGGVEELFVPGSVPRDELPPE